MVRVVAVLLMAIGAMAAACGHGAGGKLAIPRDPPLPPQGTPALTVKPGAADPFSKDDVASYFQRRNLPRNLTSTRDFRVDTLEFLTNDEVTARLNGVSPGLADGDRIGFATLSGQFVFTGPRGSTPARFTRAYAAFDARTGNLLMIGSLTPVEPSR